MMMVSFGLLFLPAAGHLNAGESGGAGELVRVWSVSGHSSDVQNALAVDVSSSPVLRMYSIKRYRAYSIRLASR